MIKDLVVCSFQWHRIKMPATYVVHLGNSRDLMEVAEDSVARRVLREHIRESLGLRKDDLVFAIINSMFIEPGNAFSQRNFLLAIYFCCCPGNLVMHILRISVPGTSNCYTMPPEPVPSSKLKCRHRRPSFPIRW